MMRNAICPSCRLRVPVLTAVDANGKQDHRFATHAHVLGDLIPQDSRGKAFTVESRLCPWSGREVPHGTA